MNEKMKGNQNGRIHYDDDFKQFSEELGVSIDNRHNLQSLTDKHEFIDKNRAAYSVSVSYLDERRRIYN